MSDQGRTIQGLRKVNRGSAPRPTDPPQPAVEAAPPQRAAEIAPPQAARTPRAAKPRAAAAPKASDRAVTGKESVTVSIPRATRTSARAAFRATQHLEDDESWSDYVSKAIAAETARRERLYNGGRPYEGGDKKLPTGRPIGS